MDIANKRLLIKLGELEALADTIRKNPINQTNYLYETLNQFESLLNQAKPLDASERGQKHLLLMLAKDKKIGERILQKHPELLLWFPAPYLRKHFNLEGVYLQWISGCYYLRLGCSLAPQ